MRPLLVGELNPYGSDPRTALYPYPPNSAGSRLRTYVLDMTLSDYMTVFDRVNLCVGSWSLPQARIRVAELGGLGRPGVILLGERVCRAYGVGYYPFSFLEPSVTAILPHPSGRCRTWNDPAARETARKLVARVIDACQKLEKTT